VIELERRVVLELFGLPVSGVVAEDFEVEVLDLRILRSAGVMGSAFCVGEIGVELLDLLVLRSAPAMLKNCCS